MHDPALDEEEEQYVDPLLGRVLADRYRVIRKVGAGGMGSIYEVEHVEIGRRLALKVLHSQFASDAGVVKRFRNEGRAASRIGHPHIVECMDFGRTPEGLPFLVMEFLEGRSLAEEMQAEGPLPVGRATRIARQVALALSAAHEKGIIHRDVKPENVFLNRRPDGTENVKVVDFGISKFDGSLSAATQTGAVLGSPYYMAPEQVHDASKANARTDVYGLGAIIYQMLTGQLPFVAKSFPMLVVKITSEDPEPVTTFRGDVPPDLVALVAHAMAKPPEDRVQTMEVFAERLVPFLRMDRDPVVLLTPEAFASTAPSSPTNTPFTTAGTIPGVRDLPKKRWPVLWAVAGLIGAAAAVAGGVALIGGPEEGTPEGGGDAPAVHGAPGGTPAGDEVLETPVAELPAPPALPPVPTLVDAGLGREQLAEDLAPPIPGTPERPGLAPAGPSPVETRRPARASRPASRRGTPPAATARTRPADSAEPTAMTTAMATPPTTAMTTTSTTMSTATMTTMAAPTTMVGLQDGVPIDDDPDF